MRRLLVRPIRSCNIYALTTRQLVPIQWLSERFRMKNFQNARMSSTAKSTANEKETKNEIRTHESRSSFFRTPKYLVLYKKKQYDLFKPRIFHFSIYKKLDTISAFYTCVDYTIACRKKTREFLRLPPTDCYLEEKSVKT